MAKNLGSILDDEALEDPALEALVRRVVGKAESAAAPVSVEVGQAEITGRTPSDKPSKATDPVSKDVDAQPMPVGRTVATSEQPSQKTQADKVSDYIRGLMRQRDQSLVDFEDARFRRSIATGFGGSRQDMINLPMRDFQERQGLVNAYAKAIAEGKEKEFTAQNEAAKVKRAEVLAAAKRQQELDDYERKRGDEEARNRRELAEQDARYGRSRSDHLRDQAASFANQREVARIQAGQKAEARSDKDVEELEKRIAPETVALASKLGKLDKLVGTYDGPEDADVPGHGPIASRLPGALLSDRGGETRQLARGVLGQLIKIQSGTAASEGEIDRKMEELGMGAGSTPRQFRTGLKNIRDELGVYLKQKQSGANPAAVGEYRKRGGLTAEDVAAAKGAMSAAQNADLSSPGPDWKSGTYKGQAGWVSPDGKKFRPK